MHKKKLVESVKTSVLRIDIFSVVVRYIKNMHAPLNNCVIDISKNRIKLDPLLLTAA